LLAVGVFAATVLLDSAQAQEEIAPPFDDHFRLTAGLLSVSSETEMRIDADDGTPGTAVNAETDLGLREQSDQADVEAELRIRERHRIRFTYVRLDRRATKAIDRQILFGNEVFDAGDVVDSNLDWREFSVTYGYTFLRNARFELYGSFGLHLVEMKAEGEVAADDVREEEAEAAPLPAFGLGTLVRFSDRFHGEARIDYFTASANDADGTVLDVRAAILYRFNRNLSVGAAYMLMEREGNSEDPGDSGHFSFRNSGPELFMRVAF
jgi:hypothetical protein